VVDEVNFKFKSKNSKEDIFASARGLAVKLLLFADTNGEDPGRTQALISILPNAINRIVNEIVTHASIIT